MDIALWSWHISQGTFLSWGWNSALFLQGKPKRRASQSLERVLRSCSKNKVRFWTKCVSITLRKGQANSWVFQTLSWTEAVEGKAKGKAVPALLLQERTCRATGGASLCVKGTLLQLQGGAAQLERSGQHWNSSWRAGAAQTARFATEGKPQQQNCKRMKKDHSQTCPAPSRIRSSHLTCHLAWCLT